MSLAGDLSGLLKEAYPLGIEDLIPKASKLRDMIPFVPSEQQNGKTYQQPVILAAEQGFSYSLDSADVYDLNDAIGMVMEQASVPGADIVLSSAISYNQAARASHSATAFKTALSTKLENMIKSAEKRLDIAMLYGQDHLASAATQAVVIANSMLPIVIDADEWAMGMWTGSVGANMVFVKASDNTAVDGLRSFKVAKVDASTRTVYFAAGTAGTAGTLTTLETAIEAYAVNIHYYGSCSGTAGTFAYAEMAGLKKQITNVGSLFGLDAATYDLLQGNSVSTTGQLTMAKVLSAVSKAVQRGLETDAVCLVNPDTWADLASNLAALRRFDGSYSKKKNSNGSEELEYISQNGKIKIVPYNIVKSGDCFIFPEDKVVRIGAWDLSLNDPSRPSEEIFFQIPGKSGVGLRAYTNQAVYLEAPAQAVYISGFTNSAA